MRTALTLALVALALATATATPLTPEEAARRLATQEAIAKTRPASHPRLITTTAPTRTVTHSWTTTTPWLQNRPPFSVQVTFTMPSSGGSFSQLVPGADGRLHPLVWSGGTGFKITNLTGRVVTSLDVDIQMEGSNPLGLLRTSFHFEGRLAPGASFKDAKEKVGTGEPRVLAARYTTIE